MNYETGVKVVLFAIILTYVIVASCSASIIVNTGRGDVNAKTNQKTTVDSTYLKLDILSKSKKKPTLKE